MFLRDIESRGIIRLFYPLPVIQFLSEFPEQKLQNKSERKICICFYFSLVKLAPRQSISHTQKLQIFFSKLID